MNIYGMSDVGRRRDNNQDCFEIRQLAENAQLIVLCDGMGGAAGGSTASTLARDTIIQQVSASYRPDLNLRSIKNIMQAAISAANIRVFDQSVNDQSLAGMGTTAVVALITDSCAYIAHVGDSRAYLIGQGGMNQLTTDHSIVQMMVESGQITADEARVHPKRNIITRAVGVSDSVKIDFDQISTAAGDRLLVCSDGLTNYAGADEICEIVKSNSAQDAVRLLVSLANQNGGGDNITVVLAEC